MVHYQGLSQLYATLYNYLLIKHRLRKARYCIEDLEDLIFQCIESIHQAKYTLNKPKYDLALATLDLLNEEYNQANNYYYIEKNRILKYYEDKWEISWKKY